LDQDSFEPKPSRKELERLRRRSDILHAARELFINKGFVSATLEEVAQAAEFGKGTIYNYFANKEELLWGMLEQFLDETAELAQAEFGSSEKTARKKFEDYAKAVISRGREHEFFHTIMKEQHVLEASDTQGRMSLLAGKIRTCWGIIAQEIEKEMAAGRFKQGNALQMAGLFDLMIRAFGMGTQSKKFPISAVPPDEVVALVVSTFLDGVAIHTVEG